MVRWILSQVNWLMSSSGRKEFGVGLSLGSQKEGEKTERNWCSLNPPLGAGICVSVEMIGNWDSEGFCASDVTQLVAELGWQSSHAELFWLMNIHLTVCLISGILLPMLISFLLSHLTICTKLFCLCFGSRLGSPPLEIVFWPSKWEGHPVSLSATAMAATTCHSVVFNYEFLQGMGTSILGVCPSHITQCVAHSKCAVNMYWMGK